MASVLPASPACAAPPPSPRLNTRKTRIDLKMERPVSRAGEGAIVSPKGAAKDVGKVARDDVRENRGLGLAQVKNDDECGGG